jgi:Ice-binding-like
MKNLLMLQTHPIHRRTTRLAVIVLFAALLSAAPFHAAFAQTAPALGSAESFAVLAGTAVTCTDSTIAGDVGVYPGLAVTQTNCTINGTVHTEDASAVAAYNDFLNAYNALALKQCDYVLSGNLGGVTLTPGVYCFDAAATVTDRLTLDGPADGVWIFKIGTSGTGALTGTNFSVVMSNGGQAFNVYWWVAEAATMTTSNFQGSILAGAATTFTGGSLIGRDFAKAAVTITGAAITGCK